MDMQIPACPEKTKQSGRFQVPLAERAGYSLREVAGLFGRHTTWAHRRVYDATFKPVIIGRRMMIPRAQVEALMAGKAVQ